MELKPFEEFIGTLEKVQTKKDQFTLVFKVITPVEIPTEGVSLSFLEECIGQRIGILHTSNGVKIRKI